MVMERKAGAAFYISAAILLLVYVVIALDILHRTLAAMMGAVAMLFISYTAGTFYPDFFIISFADAVAKVDFNVVFLLLGMMIIVGVMKETGVFEWLAYKSFHLSGGNVFRLATILIVVTAVVSAFLDNVTAMLLLVPVTIDIAIVLRINPVALLMPEVLASNIGGTATLIGDPPNMMIGSYAGLTWNDFMFNLAPVAAIILVIHILMMHFVYRKEYRGARVADVESFEKDLRAECGIRDYRLLAYSLTILAGVIFLFFFHGVLHMEPCIAALGGAALLLLVSRGNIARHLEKDVEWPTLIFFIMLFIIIGACEETGLIQIIAEWALKLSRGNLIAGVLLVLVVSALASAVVDNIPYTATMLPLVAYLSQNTPGAEGSNVLWWALSLGACLGGNATVVGASANVVTSGLSEKQGHPISFLYFMKIGVPVTVMSVIVCAIWLYVVEL
jgi:Na+/H+ antiporter NhaD/arsenite permease-like protein